MQIWRNISLLLGGKNTSKDMYIYSFFSAESAVRDLWILWLKWWDDIIKRWKLSTAMLARATGMWKIISHCVLNLLLSKRNISQLIITIKIHENITLQKMAFQSIYEQFLMTNVNFYCRFLLVLYSCWNSLRHSCLSMSQMLVSRRFKLKKVNWNKLM